MKKDKADIWLSLSIELDNEMLKAIGGKEKDWDLYFYLRSFDTWAWVNWKSER